MEEIKEAKTGKAVNFTPKEAKKPEKMSYEQLENVAHQLSNQVQQLHAKLYEANVNNIFKRLDYLFKVVENAHAFNEAFVTKCLTEIEELMTVPEPEEEAENKSE